MLQTYPQPAIGSFRFGAGAHAIPLQYPSGRGPLFGVGLQGYVPEQLNPAHPLTRSPAQRTGMQDRESDAAQVLVGLFQAFQAHANQQRIDEVQRDALRDEVYAALRQIRFLIRHGQVSPAQAREAGTQVVEAYFQAIAQLSSPSVRASAENYRAVMTDYANLNGPEAGWFYGLWDCPDVTTQAQINDTRCTRLSAAGGTPASGSGTQSPPNPGQSATPPAAGSNSIFDLLGTINLGGFAIPVLPLVAIGGILLLANR